MSIETTLAGTAANRILDGTSDAIDRLSANIDKLIRFTPIPRNFLKSNSANLSSNVSDGTIILRGPPVPRNHRGVLEDFNINFTTAAGTVRLVILDPSGSIRIDILRDISGSTNGTGRTVLEESESIAVVGQTAGAGTFAAYVSGMLQRVRDDF